MTSMRMQIIEVIKASPGIRNVEIAEKLEIDARDVQPILHPSISSGQILVGKVVAPNGREVNAYRINSDWEPGKHRQNPRVPDSEVHQQVIPAVNKGARPSPKEKETATKSASRKVSAMKVMSRKSKTAAEPVKIHTEQPKRFACALFSDGRLLLERFENDQFVLSQDETAELLRYLDRIATQEMSAA